MLKNKIEIIKMLIFSDNYFFDRFYTIEEYIKHVKPEEINKNDNFASLLKKSIKYEGLKKFKNLKTSQDEEFYELNKNDVIFSVITGILAYIAAVQVDKNGKNIEEAIDSVLPKNYDKNNAFDIKDGYGHRLIGHDIFSFGVKGIPGKAVVNVSIDGAQQIVRVCDFLGTDPETKVSMLDIIWEYYGKDNGIYKGTFNCIKHTIAHFSKDIFTPDGLPLPLTSIIDYNAFKYYQSQDRYGINYKDTLKKKLDEQNIHLKGSDFASYILIEYLLLGYKNASRIKNDDTLLNECKLIAISTCLMLHMVNIIRNETITCTKGFKKICEGSQLNLILFGNFMLIVKKLIVNIYNERNKINKYYETKLKELLNE